MSEKVTKRAEKKKEAKSKNDQCVDALQEEGGFISLSGRGLCLGAREVRIIRSFEE